MWSRFKYFVLRTFSEKGRYQLLWALIIVMAIIALSMFVAKMAFPNYSCLEAFWQSLTYMLTPVPLRELVVKDSSGKIALSIIYLLGLIAFSGTLIATFSSALRTIAEKYKNGQFAFPLRNFYVILGADKCVNMVAQIRSTNKRENIVVMTSSHIPELRKQVALAVSPKDAKNIFYVHGRRDSKHDLSKINVWKAKKIFVIGEYNETMSDAVSIDSINLIAQLAKDKKCAKKIPCHVLFTTEATNRTFFFADIEENVKKHIEFIPFIVSETIAQQVLIANKYGDVAFTPLDREGITLNSEKFVHFVILGMTEIGVAMAKIAALTAHYPNFKKRKTRITMVDSQAHKKLYTQLTSNYLLSVCSYSYFEVTEKEEFIVKETHTPESIFMDLEWQFIQANIEQPAMRSIMEQWVEESDALLTIALCSDDSDYNVSTGMLLPRTLFEQKIPVWVYTQYSGKLVDIMRSSKIYKSLKPFGMENGSLNFEHDKYMDAAKMINYVYCKGRSPMEFPPEDVEAKWKTASVSDRWSSYYNALHIRTKLRSVGIKENKIMTDSALELLLQELVSLGEVEHNRWCTEKLLLGFRPLTNEEKTAIDSKYKTKQMFKKEMFAHYDIRALKELSEDIQFYDILLIRNILRIAEDSHLFD